jgi:DNA replication and repair protein RecF
MYNKIEEEMHLKHISLINFKSYKQADFDLHPKINCFVGNNGVGKTNLLDAIFYLSMCKSNFNTIDYQNIRHTSDFFVIQGFYDRNGNDENIYCGVKKDSGKIFKRNGKEYQRLAEHIGFLPIVIISPSDSSLITEGSDERRKLINSIVSQHDSLYLDNLIKYNKLLANRNRLLKDKLNISTLTDILDVIDSQLDSLASPIHKQRVEFVKNITPIFENYYQRVSSNAESIELIYQSHLHEKNLKSLLFESIEKDRILQFTSKGIHKDDLTFMLNGHPIKKEGSQGQQKTYLIALKLAQFKYLHNISGIKPILLLDDILDKLDMERVEQFIRLVAEHEFGQIFITDTNKARLDSILEKIDSGYALFNVNVDGDINLVSSK